MAHKRSKKQTLDPQTRRTEKAILMAPLVAAFLWMGFLVLSIGGPGAFTGFAPSRLDALINALFIFIIVYSVVLFLLFMKMNKQ